MKMNDAEIVDFKYFLNYFNDKNYLSIRTSRLRVYV